MRYTSLLIMALSSAGIAAQSPVSIELVEWAEGFFNPTDITNAGDDRLFVAQQTGVIAIVVDSGNVLPTPFLDISTKVAFSAEQGLLGLAFDPAYTVNGYFYVHYVADDSLGHRSVVARFSVSTGDPDAADPLSEVVLYTWPQTTVEHKGGDLAFGPDSTLYISFGDGSSGGDPNNGAQNLSDPLGSILRVRPEPDSTYSIPSDNPFANAGGDTLHEIWAFGLRNPFRISVDPDAGALWMGDVGQSSFEEVDRWPLNDNSGPNFGWRCYEGFADYNTTLCDTTAAFVAPLAVEANVLNGGSWCAVAGGRVYRGTLFPRLLGRYVFTDYCSGQVRTLRPDGLGGWVEEVVLQSGPVGMVAIDEDANGELFAVSNFQHKVYRIVDPCPVLPALIVQDDTIIAPAGSGYAWYVDGTLLPLDTLASIIPQISGNYSVLVDLGNGCVLASDTVLFIVDGVPEWNAMPAINMYPNPATTQCTITWDNARWGSLTVDALDATGRVVRSWKCTDGAAHLDLHNMSAGCIALRSSSSEGAASYKRLIVQ